jgi:hypothetical protein
MEKESKSLDDFDCKGAKLIKNKSLRPLWFGIVVLCQTL